MAGTKRSAESSQQTSKSRKKAHVDTTSTRRITRLMTTDDPRRAVFDTTELLESVLNFLPYKTLFVSQRVSRQFRDVITNSVRLQQQMGLRLSGAAKELWTIETVQNPKIPMKIVAASFSRIDSGLTSSPLPNVVMPVESNSLLHRTASLPYEGRGSAFRLRLFNYKEVLQLVTPTRLTGTHSWHEVLLTDPPVNKAEVTLSWKLNSNVFGRVYRTVETNADLTFGMLVHDALNEEPQQQNRDYWFEKRSAKSYGDETLGETLQVLEGKYKRKAVIDEMSITLYGVVIPTSEEWAAMS